MSNIMKRLFPLREMRQKEGIIFSVEYERAYAIFIIEVVAISFIAGYIWGKI